MWGLWGISTILVRLGHFTHPSQFGGCGGISPILVSLGVVGGDTSPILVCSGFGGTLPIFVGQGFVGAQAWGWSNAVCSSHRIKLNLIYFIAKYFFTADLEHDF